MPEPEKPPPRWTLGILNDRETVDVPGSVRLLARDHDEPLGLASIPRRSSVSSLPTGIPGGFADPLPDQGRGAPPKRTSDGLMILDPQPEESANDPLNWPSWRRNLALLSVGLYCMMGGGLTPLLAAGFLAISREYRVEIASVSLTTGMFMLGLGVGSVIASPTAILFGKRTVYLGSAVTLILCSIWCALSPSFTLLVVARVFQGIAVSPVECLPGATIGEIFFLHEKAFRIGIYTLLLLGGKNTIPIVSAAIIQSLGWRWAFWIATMVVAFCGILLFLFVPESFWDRTRAPRPRSSSGPVALARRISSVARGLPCASSMPGTSSPPTPGSTSGIAPKSPRQLEDVPTPVFVCKRDKRARFADAPCRPDDHSISIDSETGLATAKGSRRGSLTSDCTTVLPTQSTRSLPAELSNLDERSSSSSDKSGYKTALREQSRSTSFSTAFEGRSRSAILAAIATPKRLDNYIDGHHDGPQKDQQQGNRHQDDRQSPQTSNTQPDNAGPDNGYTLVWKRESESPGDTGKELDAASGYAVVWENKKASQGDVHKQDASVPVGVRNEKQQMHSTTLLQGQETAPDHGQDDYNGQEYEVIWSSGGSMAVDIEKQHQPQNFGTGLPSGSLGPSLLASAPTAATDIEKQRQALGMSLPCGSMMSTSPSPTAPAEGCRRSSSLFAAGGISAAAGNPRPPSYTTALRGMPPRTFVQQLRPYHGRLSRDSWLHVALRPLVLLSYPAVIWSALVYSCSMGWLVILSQSVAVVFIQGSYRFTEFQTGLTYISPLIGGILGTAVAGKVSDVIVKAMSRRNGGLYEPEFRLIMALPVMVATVLGLMGFGWSAHAAHHWIVPTVFFGLVSLGCSMGSTTAIAFVVDSHRQYSGEALVALNFCKNVLHGMVFSLFFTRWLITDGSETVFVALGVIHFVVMLTTVPMYVFGKRARMWTVRKNYMERFWNNKSPR